MAWPLVALLIARAARQGSGRRALVPTIAVSALLASDDEESVRAALDAGGVRLRGEAGRARPDHRGHQSG